MNDVITPNSSGDGGDERIFLEAARSGDLDTVKRLCNTANVNCRDFEGRQSTPLHFAAGYNRVEVVEYLLTMGADVQAKDKVSSYKMFLARVAPKNCFQRTQNSPSPQKIRLQSSTRSILETIICSGS